MTEPSIAAWRKSLKAHPEANFLQSPEWQKVNQQIGHTPIIEQFGKKSLALMIIKNAKRGRYLEIPGGPLLDWNDTAELEQAFTKIRAIASQHNCVFIRFRPQLANTPENLAKMQVLGARIAPFHLHAEHTVMIDLTKDANEILKNMRRQTRYEVRRSIKQDIKVRHDNTEALFREFHDVQAETAARQHFIPPRLSDLLAYREAFGSAAQIYVAEIQIDESSDTPAPIAYGLILHSGEEADYFEAASTSLNRKLPGAYALQWQVIQDLQKQGIKRYNLWGIAPPNQPHHRYAKVTTFKTGFGGETVEYLPAHDIIISPSRYLKTKLIETIRKKRRHLS